MRRPLAAIAALLLATGASAPSRQVATIANPEDMAPLPGGQWVIASSMAGGQAASGRLAAIAVAGGTVRDVYPIGAARARAETPGCDGEIAAADFRPHGIALARTPAGATRLYVVNHGGRESIEMFAVEGAALPRLRWIGCAILPPGRFGNSVTVTPDGTLYMTNMGKPLGGGEALSPMGGEIVVWRAGTGWRTVPDSAIHGPNGIVSSPDGKRLYVAAWPAGELVELAIASARTARRTVRLGFLPDNLRWSPAGTILATGHRTPARTVEACYVSARARCTIPSAVSEIDPETLAIRCTRSVPQDMATSAIVVGTETWLGTARGGGIVAITRDCPRAWPRPR